MPVPLVEGVDLGGVDACAGGHLHELDHFPRRAGLHPHGPDRRLPLQFLDADLEQTTRLVGREDVPFAAPAASEVDADAGRGHAPQVAPGRRLVKGAVLGEGRDADDEGAGPARAIRSGVPWANAQALPTESNLNSRSELPARMACFSSGGTSLNVALMVFHE